MGVWEICTAAALCGIVFFLIREAKKKLLLPKTGCPGVTVTAVVRAEGEAPCLEQTVSGLVWLRDSGGMGLEIVIEDAGLTPGQRALADILAREKGARLRDARKEKEAGD